METAGDGVPLIELLASVSLGADLGMGHPLEHALRQTHLALRLGEELGLDDDELDVICQTSLMAWVGCHVDAYEQAKWFGDDRAIKHNIRSIDLGRPVRSAAFTLRSVGSGRSALGRLRTGVAFVGEGPRHLEDMLLNHWRAVDLLAERLELGDDVRESLGHTFERFDGKGDPGDVAGTDVSLASRLVNLADVTEIFHAVGGVDAAMQVARDRAGSQFDPDLVDLLCSRGDEVFGELDDLDGWGQVTGRGRGGPVLDGDRLDDALEAIGEFASLKTPFAIGHARRVGDLARAAGDAAGLSASDERLLRRAAVLHDVGQLGVANSVWDKPGRLTAAEWEHVRMHPYLVDRMFAGCATLAAVGRLASEHHERLDGSGYPRGLRGDALSPSARLLAAADVYQTCLEPRPHRAESTAAEAEAQLRDEVTVGRLDGDAVNAVLRAAGHRVRRRRQWPCGLTAREVEVLRLVAQGRSHRQIAEELIIARKTASNHVERIYAKIGVSNRAMAAMFAMQHGLMDDRRA